MKNFYSLNVKEKVKFINELMSQYGSLTKACKNANLSKGTVSSNFLTHGYVFSKILNRYVPAEQKEIQENFFKEEEEKDVEIVINKKYVEGLEEKINKFTTIADDLNHLLKMKPDVEEVVKNFHLNRNLIEFPELKMATHRMKGNVSTKTFKIYDDILSMFNDVVVENPQFKLQDIVSQALLEFATKYKKEFK